MSIFQCWIICTLTMDLCLINCNEVMIVGGNIVSMTQPFIAAMTDLCNIQLQTHNKDKLFLLSPFFVRLTSKVNCVIGTFCKIM